MTIEERIISSIMILFTSTLFALIRKWNNTDADAGMGFMSWGLAGIIMVWLW